LGWRQPKFFQPASQVERTWLTARPLRHAEGSGNLACGALWRSGRWRKLGRRQRWMARRAVAELGRRQLWRAHRARTRARMALARQQWRRALLVQLSAEQRLRGGGAERGGPTGLIARGSSRRRADAKGGRGGWPGDRLARPKTLRARLAAARQLLRGVQTTHAGLRALQETDCCACCTRG